jgi:hypothetical protein
MLRGPRRNPEQFIKPPLYLKVNQSEEMGRVVGHIIAPQTRLQTMPEPLSAGKARGDPGDCRSVCGEAVSRGQDTGVQFQLLRRIFRLLFWCNTQ